jgi:hypothetical protein
MSFLDHLDELRKRLIRIAIFIAVAFVVCFFVSEQIYNFLQVPVRAAMLDAKKAFATELSGTAIALSDLPDDTDVIFTCRLRPSLANLISRARPSLQSKTRCGGHRSARDRRLLG